MHTTLTKRYTDLKIVNAEVFINTWVAKIPIYVIPWKSLTHLKLKANSYENARLPGGL